VTCCAHAITLLLLLPLPLLLLLVLMQVSVTIPRYARTASHLCFLPRQRVPAGQCSTEAATVVPSRWRPKVRWRPVSGTPESVTVDVGVYLLQHFASCITFSGHDRLHKCWLNWDVAPLHHMQGATTMLRCYQQFARLACNKMVLCSAVP
jgi:hypothetical protein